MIRWVAVIFIALIIFPALLPFLQKLGIGRAPGDFRFKLFGRIFRCLSARHWWCARSHS